MDGVHNKNSNIPLGGVSYSPNLLLMCSQRCSIGLRSGDCAGHCRRVNPWFLNHSWAFCRCVWGHCLADICSSCMTLFMSLPCEPPVASTLLSSPLTPFLQTSSMPLQQPFPLLSWNCTTCLTNSLEVSKHRSPPPTSYPFFCFFFCSSTASS